MVLPLQLDDLVHQTADKSVVAVHELGEDAGAAENEAEDDQFSTALRDKFSFKTSGDLSYDLNKLFKPEERDEMLKHYDRLDATTKQGKNDWIRNTIETIVLGARPPQTEKNEGKSTEAQLELLKLASRAGTAPLLDQDMVDDTDITAESYKNVTYGFRFA